MVAGIGRLRKSLCSLLLGGLLLGGLLLGGSLTPALLSWPALAEEGDEPFLLQLDGSTLSEYVMICDIIAEGREERIRRKEYLPHSYSFKVDALDCRITLLESHSRISAILSRGGTIIDADEINGTRVGIGARSDGPWGRADVWRIGGTRRFLPLE